MYSILHDVYIDAQAEKIFAAISQSDHINNWWTKECESNAKLGASYRFYFSPEYDWYAEVSAIKPNVFLELQMTKSDKDWDTTKFGFSLTSKGSGTLLSFYHKNWKTTNHHFRRTSYSWALLLQGLKNYVEKGEVVAFAQRS